MASPRGNVLLAASSITLLAAVTWLLGYCRVTTTEPQLGDDGAEQYCVFPAFDGGVRIAVVFALGFFIGFSHSFAFSYFING